MTKHITIDESIAAPLTCIICSSAAVSSTNPDFFFNVADALPCSRFS